jgi:methylisocitrate lyase
MIEDRAKQLRDMLTKPPVVCLGAHDPLSALLAEEAGAKALCLGGFAASAAYLGRPDLGLMSQTEVADHIRRVCNVVKIPVIADADNGYGGVFNVQRTVELWEAAGAAALHIEDQVFPKRCGHMPGKEVVPVEEMVAKLEAAQRARRNPAFLLIARTDALAVSGLDEAIARCRRYAEAGADALFVDAPESVEHLRRIGEELKSLRKPLVFNAARTMKSPIVKVSELSSLGFSIVLYPIEGLFTAHKAMAQTYKTLLADGSTAGIADRMTSFVDFNNFLGLAEYFEQERNVVKKQAQNGR